MPNWTRNNVIFSGQQDQIDQLKRTLAGEYGCFDFNSILPMPKELNIESRFMLEQCMYLVLSEMEPEKAKNVSKLFSKESFYRALPATEKGNDARVKIPYLDINKMRRLGRQVISNMEKYGAKDWYDWRKEHWGTKWNALNAVQDNNGYSFDTAWSYPNGIVNVLVQLIQDKFPGVHMCWEYLDDDSDNDGFIVAAEI